eukprot:15365063-Ditylum_brightwellii.AAC.1
MEVDDRAAVRHMWYYYDLNFKTFCASLGNSPSDWPLKPFTCCALDKVMSFCYKGNATLKQTICLNVGDCNNHMEQGLQEEIQKMIFEDMTTQAVDDYNEKINQLLKCPFWSLKRAINRDYCVTKIETKSCKEANAM